MNEEIIILIKIILIDLVLSADNAIVIGMTASQFNDQIRKKVLIYGTIAAVVCRIIFAGATAFLLKINGIKTFVSAVLASLRQNTMFCDRFVSTRCDIG